MRLSCQTAICQHHRIALHTSIRGEIEFSSINALTRSPLSIYRDGQFRKKVLMIKAGPLRSMRVDFIVVEFYDAH
jgi:hypothetical protein